MPPMAILAPPPHHLNPLASRATLPHLQHPQPGPAARVPPQHAAACAAAAPHSLGFAASSHHRDQSGDRVLGRRGHAGTGRPTLWPLRSLHCSHANMQWEGISQLHTSCGQLHLPPSINISATISSDCLLAAAHNTQKFAKQIRCGRARGVHSLFLTRVSLASRTSPGSALSIKTTQPEPVLQTPCSWRDT
mgnify:CR=1 FL=1